MTMSRDGLLWPKFAKIHPKYHTPSFATIITGLLVAVPSLFLDMQFFIDLTSVGTFFAFIMVCGGILYLDDSGLSEQSKFKVTYINGKYIVGIGLAIALAYALITDSFASSMAEKPLMAIFWLVWGGLAALAFRRNFSLLPVLGVLTNLYLMTELGITNWAIFVVWLVIGLVVYFSYGYRKSKLA